MGVYAFKLPDVGEGMAEGTIGKWYVHEGDSIKKDADLVQIENDKSVEDLTSPVTGKLKDHCSRRRYRQRWRSIDRNRDCR